MASAFDAFLQQAWADHADQAPAGCQAALGKLKALSP